MQTRTIYASQLQDMLAGAQVLESDGRGVKVAKLANGDFLKVFRIRNRWSLARLYPYSRRFCGNAERLLQLGYSTIHVQERLQLIGSDVSAVVYTPLPGRTLRQLIDAQGALAASLCAELGAFIARLHGDGVLFRSLHLGNVLQLPNGQFGLIDIADLRLYRRRLSRGKRWRNWRHLMRYAGDIAGVAIDELLEGYRLACGLSERDWRWLESRCRPALAALQGRGGRG